MVVYRVRAGDGSWRWAELVASSMLDEPAVAGIVANVRDVTEREEAIRELRSSEARFRSLFEHANDVGFLTDAEGIVRYVTPSLHDVLGYQPEDIVGRASWTAFGVAATEISTSEGIAAVAIPGSRIDFTATLLAADGTPRWFEITVRNLLDDEAVKGFATNLRDVTDRMQALSALRTSEAKQRAIVARSNELTMFFELDGTIAWVSPAAAEVFDVEPQDLVGRTGFDMIHPDDLDRVVGEFMTIPNLGDHVCAEFRVIDDAGRIRWVEEVVTNLLDDPDVGYHVANIRDITAQRAAAEALAASEARYRSIVETAHEGIWVTALDGSTVFANATMAEMLGCDVSALEAGSLQDSLSSGARQTIEALNRAGVDGESVRGEARFARDGQSDLWAIVSTSPLRNRVGEVDGCLHMITDITERKAMEDELTRIAIHDPLTGLPNRGLLVNRLERSLARRSRLPTAVICLDLDNFKDINDSLGSAEGDEVLIAVGTRLRGAARAEDTVSRFGGDEYVVLCEEVADASEAVALAEVLHAAVRAPFTIGSEEVVISASIGVALSPPAEAAAVLRCADTAMYRAKRQGRGRITLFDEAPNQAAQQRLSTQFQLLRALENDELVVWYQPILDLQRGTVDAVEALVRWQHPERGLLLPADFIPVAEASGLVREVGWRVLEIACRDATTWYADSNALRLSINLAAAQLSDESLLPRIHAVLANTGLPPDGLTLELTESAAMHDEVAIALQLRKLRDLGIHLALDDFGTGYSSLSLLRRLPITAVKIDRSFVSGLGVSRDDTLIVGGVISMARAMGHAVVAEGIETEAQRDEVSRLGCRYGQGYLFSRAVPLDELQAAIAGINQRSRDRSQPGEPQFRA
jgi:diguanylate cyclase (GGDEF)-like protein/PAS domain S-box-containing protein